MISLTITQRRCSRNETGSWSGIDAAGFDVIVPQGTYFVTADIASLGETDGIDFCMSLPKRCGVVAVPTQVFYDNPEAGRLLVRFAFCKRDEVLDEASRRLQQLGQPAAGAS